MNRWIGIGRLVTDPNVRYMQGEYSTAVARYRLAVNRSFKNQNGTYDADYINCVCFGKTAEFAEKYLKKGMKVAVSGRIQTGSYINKDRNTVYTTDIVVEEHDFCESKNQSGSSNIQQENNGFINIPEGIDEELPFN